MELVNISNQTIDLAGAQLARNANQWRRSRDWICVRRWSDQQAGAGQRLLVVENVSAFAARYGNELPVAGQWVGGLNNTGETITLEYADGTRHQFAYSDRWYRDTDGEGPSLEIVDPARRRILPAGRRLCLGGQVFRSEAHRARVLDYPAMRTPINRSTSRICCWPGRRASTKTRQLITRCSTMAIGTATATLIQATWYFCSYLGFIAKQRPRQWPGRM